MACLVSTKEDRPGEPFESWLRRHGQTDRTIERYWGTVLVSALNERLDRMDVGHARKVFLDGFLRHRDGFRMEIPLAPLGEIYGTRLERWLAEQGVEVRLTTGVRSVEVDDEGHLAGLELRSGEPVEADFVVLASPFDRVAGLLPAPILERIPSLDGLGADRVIADHRRPPLVRPPGLPLRARRHGRPAGPVGLRPLGDPGPLHPRRPGAVPPGRHQRELRPLAMDKTQILDAVLADLAAIWPESKEAKLTRSWVVTEHGATFAVRPGIDALRPPQRTPIEACSWPATGPRPAGRPRWKGRSGAATWPPKESSKTSAGPKDSSAPAFRPAGSPGGCSGPVN